MISYNSQSGHSEPFQEIMGTIPSGIVRWGIIVVTVMFAIIVIGCSLVKYPQKISASISLTSTNPPARLEAKYSGIIDTIAVTNGEYVKQGDLIALLKTPASFEDVMSVKAFAEIAIRNCSSSELADNRLFETPLKLGILQGKWDELRSLAKEYQLYHHLNQIGKTRHYLSRQLSANNEHYETLLIQRNLIEQDMEQQLIAMRRDSILGQNARAEYEAKQQIYTYKLNSLALADASLTAVKLATLFLEQKLNEMGFQQWAEEDEFDQRWSRTISGLLAQIAAWTETFAIISPFDGVVSLQNFCDIRQQVTVGDILASVAPFNEEGVKGRMMVSSNDFGKICQGQTVNVRLNSFPYIEYGIIKGIISKIYRAPEKSQDGTVAYKVEVSFPDGLVSTYRKSIPFIQDMDGKAEIVTRDQRLIEYFIEPIISLFKNQ